MLLACLRASILATTTVRLEPATVPVHRASGREPVDRGPSAEAGAAGWAIAGGIALAIAAVVVVVVLLANSSSSKSSSTPTTKSASVDRTTTIVQPTSTTTTSTTR